MCSQNVLMSASSGTIRSPVYVIFIVINRVSGPRLLGLTEIRRLLSGTPQSRLQTTASKSHCRIRSAPKSHCYCCSARRDNLEEVQVDRKSTRLNSSHLGISYA